MLRSRKCNKSNKKVAQFMRHQNKLIIAIPNKSKTLRKIEKVLERVINMKNKIMENKEKISQEILVEFPINL